MMKNLFVVDGASGTGKSDLLQYVIQTSGKVSVVQKITTREMREYEKQNWFLDLEFVSANEFDNLQFDYWYPYSYEKYGFNKSDIYDAFTKAPNVFIIVRDHEVIEDIIRDFHFINVIPVYVYTDPITVLNRLKKQPMTEAQIQFRISRLNLAYEDYIQRSTIYREVLINNSNITDYHRLIKAMIDKYRHCPDIDDELVFILMSFNPSNPSLEDYASAIKRAVIKHYPKMRCINLDDLKGSFKISQEAKRHISECRLAIVDLTENKPNVFYELGFAHASQKNVIITSHVSTEMLFYPSEYKVVRYESGADLYRKLLKELDGQIPNS